MSGKILLSVILSGLFGIVQAQKWQMLSSLPQVNNLNCIKFVNFNTGFAVGDNGTILKTNNTGETWMVLNFPISSNFNSVFPLNANTWYVVGDSGRIYKSTNGGLGIRGMVSVNP